MMFRLKRHLKTRVQDSGRRGSERSRDRGDFQAIRFER